MSISANKKVKFILLFTRLSIFLVMFMWTLDKFVNPEHATKVFATFYSLPSLGNIIIYIIGALEMVLLAMFLLGIRKTLSYGFVLILHTFSTFAAYKLYLDPFNNLLFFAAWPMLAACLFLFFLRHEDTFLTKK